MSLEIWLLMSFGIATLNLCQMYFANTQDCEYYHTPLGVMIVAAVLSFIPIVQIVVLLVFVCVSCILVFRKITGGTRIMDYYPGRKNDKHNI